MEEELAASPDKTFLAPRLYSLGFLNDAINRNNYSIDARKLWLDNAARGRQEAQRRMALEYLLEGLL